MEHFILITHTHTRTRRERERERERVPYITQPLEDDSKPPLNRCFTTDSILPLTKRSG